jgi:hypothetical protein
MPKTPIDYSKNLTYKIEHIHDKSLVYVGHTTNWNKRKGQHKSCCKNENCKDYNRRVYQMIRNNGGWDMFRMIEIEKYPCNDKREAERRENDVMKELKANMNTYKSFRTLEEAKEYSSDYMKGYYKGYLEANRQKINETIQCECGCELFRRNLKRHQTTEKHTDLIKNIQSI